MFLTHTVPYVMIGVVLAWVDLCVVLEGGSTVCGGIELSLCVYRVQMETCHARGDDVDGNKEKQRGKQVALGRLLFLDSASRRGIESGGCESARLVMRAWRCIEE